MAGGRHGDEALEMFTELFALEEILGEQEQDARTLGEEPNRGYGRQGNEAALSSLMTLKGAEALAGS
ncbi:hypothetical protein D3C76_1630730 [compost metagenome]